LTGSTGPAGPTGATGATGATGPAGDSHWLLFDTFFDTATYYTAGNVGIGTSNPAHPLQVNSNEEISLSAENGASSGFTYGVWGESASTDGRGVSGRATAGTGINYGVEGRSASTSGRGVFAVASATSGATYGVWGQSASTNGNGVFGLATAGGGVTTGVWGQSASPTGRGVYGLATATSENITYGVLGQSASPRGLGVFGWATAGTGFTNGVGGESASTSGRGVLGVATATSGMNYGVLGQTFSPSGYGVFSFGNSGASGTKSFVIDHPLDPENQYLKHYSAEGPEPQNIYNGTVLLDARGEAWVELPDYFAAINRDPRYQLTCIGGFAGVFIADKIDFAAATSRFRIAGGRPGLEVSWMVMTVRDDPYVHRYGAPVEVLKDAALRGTYLHPELYGQPRERAENYRDLPASTEAVIDPAQAIAGDPR